MPDTHIPRAPGSLTLRRTADGAALHLSGEIDAAAVLEFERRQMAEDAGQEDVADLVHTVDVTDVTFINSTAIAFIVRQTESARRNGRRPLVRGASRRVRRVFDVVGLSAMFAW